MPKVLIDKKGNVVIYEYREDRIDCKCKYDVIIVPESFVNPEILDRLKRIKEPIKL